MMVSGPKLKDLYLLHQQFVTVVSVSQPFQWWLEVNLPATFVPVGEGSSVGISLTKLVRVAKLGRVLVAVENRFETECTQEQMTPA